MTEEEYQADKEARARLTEQTNKVHAESQPTPTQEEHDKMRLGLMHPDDMVQAETPQMPSLRAQNALLGHAQETASVPDRPTPQPIPVVVDVPYASGTGAVGETLNCTMGNWENMDEGTYAYQWKNDGSTDLGTDASYVVAAGDAGHSITCVVTATNASGSTAAPPSNAISIAASEAASSARRR